MQTQIRTATQADEAEVYRLICILEDTALDRAAFADIYREQLADPSHHIILVGQAEVGLCAVLHLRCEGQLHHAAKTAELLEFCVDPARRGQGTGGQLFRAACEAARRAGCVQVNLVSNVSRTAAHRFYERQGMVHSHAGFTLDLG